MIPSTLTQHLSLNLLSSGCGPLDAVRPQPNDAGFAPTLQPDTSVPPVLVDQKQVQGNLLNLIGGKRGALPGCFGLNTQDGMLRLVFAAKGAEPQIHTVVSPIELAKVDYALSGTQLANGNVAVPYQTTVGVNGSDGSQQGVLIVGHSGEFVQQIDLNALGFTRPTAVVERNGKLYVLVSNGSVSTVNGILITYEDPSALLEFEPNAAGAYALKRSVLLDNGPYRNASAMAVNENEFVIALADSTLMNNRSVPSAIVVLNADTFEIHSESVTGLIEGVGLNGLAPVTENGMVVFTGYDRDNGRNPLYLFRQNPYVERPVDLVQAAQNSSENGSPYLGAFIAGAAAYGNGALVAINGVPPFLMDFESEKIISFGTSYPDYPLPFASYGLGNYCNASQGKISFWDSEMVLK